MVNLQGNCPIYTLKNTNSLSNKKHFLSLFFSFLFLSRFNLSLKIELLFFLVNYVITSNHRKNSELDCMFGRGRCATIKFEISPKKSQLEKIKKICFLEMKKCIILKPCCYIKERHPHVKALHKLQSPKRTKTSIVITVN